ncbi:MAG TPA: GGDEF domain-containing protein [Candidatus Limnocylindria bacterium]
MAATPGDMLPEIARTRALRPPFDPEPEMTVGQDTTRREAAYALAVSGVAIGLVLWLTGTYPVKQSIALHWNGVAGSTALLAGVGYWMLFGLLGALRARYMEGGSVLTFHMPFVVAGTILGGPVVGGWMGILSQFERREFESVRWYGLLGNHGIIAIAAIAAGAAGDAVAPLAVALGADPGVAEFTSSIAVATIFAIVNFVLVLPVVSIRGNSGLLEAARSYDAAFRATVVAEGILAWLMASMYLSAGWWAPIACVAVVLAVWDAHDRSRRLIHDPMTGLLNGTGFQPRLRAALASQRSGRHVHGLLMLDLDGFGALNKDVGEHAADQVLVAVARRLQAAVRTTDVVARPHRAGDEFSILLLDLPDAATASTLAWRIHDRVRAPILLRGMDETVSVGVSIGVLILGDEAGTSEEAVRITDRRMQYAKRHDLGVLASTPA